MSRSGVSFAVHIDTKGDHMCDGPIDLGTVKKNIRNRGWHVTAVHGGGDFAYTSGLTENGLPELLCHGLPARLAYEVFAELRETMLDDPALVAPSMTIHGAVGGIPALSFVEVLDRSDMVVTRALYPQFTALQVVWPDAYGVFPWEEHYSMCADHQPLRGI